MRPPILLICALGAAACSRSPHEGYKIVADEVHMRYVTLGDGEQVPSDGDSVLMRFRASVLDEDPGSLWSTERWYLVRDLRHGALVPILRRLHVGDSMSVIAPSGSWPWAALLRGDLLPPHDSLTVRTELALRDRITPQQMHQRKELRRREDPYAFEQRLIEAYVAIEPGSWTRWGTSDMHYRIKGLAADTASWRKTMPLLVEWEGFRLEDGRRIDATELNGGPFHWDFGTPDQLLRGLEVAVGLLREGQEGEFIIPSEMAFRGRGLPGVLEPHAPVRYVVRVRSVQHP